MTTCPWASSAALTIPRARSTGGVGRRCPLSRIRPCPQSPCTLEARGRAEYSPNASFLPDTSTFRQGIGNTFGSRSHGLVDDTACANSSSESRSFAMGPLTLLTASCPGSPALAPSVGKRPNDGLSEYSPQKDAGMPGVVSMGKGACTGDCRDTRVA
jgi:hypothetical protein